MKNIAIAIKNPNSLPNRMNSFVIGSNGNPYTLNHLEISDVYIHDVNYAAMFCAVFQGNSNDDISIENVLMERANVLHYGIGIGYVDSGFVRNLTFQNTEGLSLPVIYTATLGSLELKDFMVKNFTGTVSPQYPIVSLENSPIIVVKIEDISIEDSRMLGSKIVELLRQTDPVTINGIRISNSTVSGGNSLFSLRTIMHLETSNHTIYRLTNEEGDNDGSAVIQIYSLDLQSDYDTEHYQNVFASESTVAFIKIDGLRNAPKTFKQINYSNFIFQDMQVGINLNLIDTSGLSYDSDVRFEFSNLTFSNITYTSSGSILRLGHQLKQSLIIRDSLFSSLNSTNLIVGTDSSVNEAQTTKVQFVNTKINSFYSESGSFVSVYKGAVLDLHNCSFSNLHTLSAGSAVKAGPSKATVTISDSSFLNNSAAEGSIFSIESESVLT